MAHPLKTASDVASAIEAGPDVEVTLTLRQLAQYRDRVSTATRRTPKDPVVAALVENLSQAVPEISAKDQQQERSEMIAAARKNRVPSSSSEAGDRVIV